MKKSESIKELASALAKAQGQFETAEREKTASVQMKSGGKYSYSYADLAAYLEVCRRPLAENGLCITQEAVTEGNRVHVTTLLMHASGEWIESTPLSLAIVARGDSIDPQAVGSAITYARRYALSAVLGMASEVDDDGSKASKPTAQTAKLAKQEQPPATGSPSVISGWRERIVKAETIDALNAIVADFVTWKKTFPTHTENGEIWRQIGLAAEGEFAATFDKASMKFVGPAAMAETEFPI